MGGYYSYLHNDRLFSDGSELAVYVGIPLGFVAGLVGGIVSMPFKKVERYEIDYHYAKFKMFTYVITKQ